MKTRVVKMDPKTLKLLELNARYMRHETFQRLVANVKTDEALTQIPFACLDPDGKYLVLSGNHRVKASMEAGLLEIDVQITDEDLPPARRLAIQLSHNAITGEDDPTILKQLYEAIADVDAKLYSGLDDKTLALLAASPDLDSLSEPNLNFQVLSMAFLPDELDAFKLAIKDAAVLLTGDDRLAVRLADYDAFMNAVLQAGQAANVQNAATSLMVMLDVFNRHKLTLRDEWLDDTGGAKHDGWVPLSSIFGRDTVPAKAAAVIARAVDRMADQGVITKGNLWQALEFWAADSLAGPAATPKPEDRQ